MNHSLKALMTKLTWQLDSLQEHLSPIVMKLQETQQQLQDLASELNQSSRASLLINPEFEINRLNFITQKEETKNKLILARKDQQATATQLEEKITRVKSEMKMLEKYLERKNLENNKTAQTMQNNGMDEWTIQKRKAV